MTKRNETTLATRQVPGPPLPNVRFQVRAKETSLGGSAGPGAKSVLAMGSKRDQPMGLVLRAWLGGSCLTLGHPGHGSERESVQCSSDSA